MTMENVLAAHELAQLDKTVISNAVHYLRFCKTVTETVDALESSNRYLAKCRDENPDKFVAMATCVPGGGTTDASKDYRLASSISRPADNCLSLARLIVRGIFEQFPKLKLVGSHLGGGICEVIGRMDYAYELQDFCFFLGSYEPMLIKHKPSHYLKMMYFDSASYTPLAAEMCFKTVGADHFLLGTDSPPLIPLKMMAVKMMDEIGMTPAQREKVMGGNAARLLKLN